MSSPTYQGVSGFFLQDSVSAVLPAVPPRLGLVDESPERWTKFIASIRTLNEDADKGTSYKVIFFSRHGQGYHNVAEAQYGTDAWDDHWAKLNGDGVLVWGPDPELTLIGKGQANIAHDAWAIELPFGIPIPSKLISSPLTRAMQTLQITFNGILGLGTNSRKETIVVVENCREENGVHTCDKRRSRTYVETAFPDFRIEEGFTEEDELWHAEERETKADVAARAKKVLDAIFDGDDTFVSVTAHGGIINGFLISIGRPPYPLPTGGVIPVVVKSVRHTG